MNIINNSIINNNNDNDNDIVRWNSTNYWHTIIFAVRAVRAGVRAVSARCAVRCAVRAVQQGLGAAGTGASAKAC